MSEHLERAQVLLAQHRHDLAEEQVRLALVESPDDAVAHASLAYCLLQRAKLEEATTEAQMAIGLDPQYAWAQSVLAHVMIERNRLREAEAAAREALALEPGNPDFSATLAQVFLRRQDWRSALETASQGLLHDAAHVDCINVRAAALTNLGRHDEATSAVAGNLQRNPENATSHANLGWNYLHQGQPKKAAEHFREALRLNPGHEWARHGMVEALKARNPVYGLMLRYFLWMARHNSQVRWGVVIGLWLLYQGLRALAQNSPALAPYIWPVLIAYIAFAILTWLSAPLFNLLLRLSRYGRFLLSDDQRRGSTWTALPLGAALVCLVVWLCTRNGVPLLAALVLGLVTLPASLIYMVPAGSPRRVMALYTVGLLVVPPAAIVLELYHVAAVDAKSTMEVFVWGCVLSQVVAAFLLKARR